MELKSLPRELVVEVLDYLADYERFEGLSPILEGEYSLRDVRGALREIAASLRKEIEADKGEKGMADLLKGKFLSPQARHVLSGLSSQDERKLLARFGLVEND